MSSTLASSSFTLTILQDLPGARKRIIKESKWKKNDDSENSENINTFDRYVKLTSHKHLPALPSICFSQEQLQAKECSIVSEYLVPTEKLYCEEEKNVEAEEKEAGTTNNNHKSSSSAIEQQQQSVEIPMDLDNDESYEQSCKIHRIRSQILALGPVGTKEDNKRELSFVAADDMARNIAQVYGQEDLEELLEESSERQRFYDLVSFIASIS